MNTLIAWATFAGAWLLVAGPLYQGSVELNEQQAMLAQLSQAQREQMASFQSKSTGWFTVAAGATTEQP
jgi:hypothetical protein